MSNLFTVMLEQILFSSNFYTYTHVTATRLRECILIPNRLFHVIP